VNQRIHIQAFFFRVCLFVDEQTLACSTRSKRILKHTEYMLPGASAALQKTSGDRNFSDFVVIALSTLGQKPGIASRVVPNFIRLQLCHCKVLRDLLHIWLDRNHSLIKTMHVAFFEPLPNQNSQL
jgi:hypothetical protein